MEKLLKYASRLTPPLAPKLFLLQKTFQQNKQQLICHPPAIIGFLGLSSALFFLLNHFMGGGLAIMDSFLPGSSQPWYAALIVVPVALLALGFCLTALLGFTWMVKDCLDTWQANALAQEFRSFCAQGQSRKLAHRVSHQHPISCPKML